MKKGFLLIIPGLIIGFLLYAFFYYEKGMFKGFIKDLADYSEVSINEISCYKSMESRYGYCLFIIDETSLQSFVSRLKLTSNENYVQNMGCLDIKEFSDFIENPEQIKRFVYGRGPGAAIAPESLLHDKKQNIMFHSLYYNQNTKKVCMELGFPYG